MTVEKTTPQTSIDHPREPFHFVAARQDDLQDLGGRRTWMEYLDLGVTDATGGFMRAQRTRVTAEGHEVTGWHYHLCELQWVYVLRGWEDLQIEDGRTLRLEAGDSVLLPGGYRHNEVLMSSDLDVLEISVPAQMGTVNCDAPPAWADRSEEVPG
jgi:quercetin dioxygenase-like cupin family protein